MSVNLIVALLKRRRQITLSVVLALGYFLLSDLAKRLAISPGNVSAFWPASGVALGFTLRYGYGCWLGIFFGNLAANLPAFFDGSTLWTATNAVLTGIAIGIGDTLQTLSATYLLRRNNPSENFSCDTPTQSLKFLVIVAATHLLSPLIGISSLLLGGYLERDQVLFGFVTWYTGDLLGALFLSGFVLEASRQNIQEILTRIGPLLAALVAGSLSYYLIWMDSSLFSLIYTFPFMVVYALYASRFAIVWTNMCLVFASILALISTQKVVVDLNSRLISLQSFMLVLYLVTVTITSFIRERRKLQMQLDHARILSLHQGKLASLGELAGGVAHEINNPLAIIAGEARIIGRIAQRDPLDHELLNSHLRILERTVERITKIVHGLRSLSNHKKAIEFEKFPLSQLLDEIMSISSERLRTLSIAVRFECEENIELCANKVQISQVLLNLLNNAIDALNEIPWEERWILFGARVTGNNFEISVTNSGPGIDEKISQRIFEPFFTTKEVGKGTGIGLSISTSIIESHGGRIYLDRSSVHTRFVFTLPRVVSSA